MAISFNGTTKVISLSTGTNTLSVRDLWSRWVDWFVTGDNSKYLVAMSNVGGDDIDQSEGTLIPIYVFLQNGWKIKPQEANHTLRVFDGILLVDGGGDPFTNTTGSFIVRINYSQPVAAISFSSEGGSGGTGLTKQDVRDAIGMSDPNLDSQLNDIKEVTSKLNTMLEVESGSYRFTEAALVNAPTGSGGSIPTPSEIAEAVRTELTVELANMDIAVSSRLAAITYTPPLSISDILDAPLSVYNTEGTVGKTLKDTLLNAKMAFYVSA